uniref:CSON011597 protein n=1 Tax=Culicoides sonorensis TaxID=179676 RepID=A0A336LFJ9_CULSO
MSKRNVAFIKPDEPSFLKQIKEQIGYKEGPDINTKRQKLELEDDDDLSDNAQELDEESPQVVVLKDGDLTAEQAEIEKKRIELEESQKKADLSERIIFKKKSKTVDPDKAVKDKTAAKKEKKASKAAASKLSFADDDEEENEGRSQ